MLNAHKHYDLASWIEFTQLKCIREYKEQELEAFKKPFYAGWKRELSIRAQLHSSGKRIVDIYYISPCNQHRLKSYIELGFYLKNTPDQKLEPENFTFAKQPVYKYPEEVIKQVLKTTKQIRAEQSRQYAAAAAASGESNGHPTMPQLTPIRSDGNRSGLDSLNNSLNSVAEGRSKRKRTAPTRFDDEEYFEQGVLTKRKMPQSPGQQMVPVIKIPKSALTPLTPKGKLDGSKADNSEDRESICSFKSFKSSKSGRSEQQGGRPSNAQLDANLLNNENSETVDSNLKDLDDDSNLSKNENSQDQPSQQAAQPTDPPPASKPPAKKKKKPAPKANPELSLMNSLLENSLLMETYNSLGMNSLLQNGNFECEDNDLLDCEFVVDTKKSADQQLPIPPCSLACPGRKNDIPSLICSRCLCLYHPQCVRSGLFMRGTKKFVCPNCVQPEDHRNAIDDPSELFENPPDIEEQPIEASFAEEAQVAPKPQPPAKPQQQPKEKLVNQSNSAAKVPPKMQINFANTFPKMNGGSEHQQQHQPKMQQAHPKKKPQSQQHLPPQIRLPPQRILNANQVMPPNLSKKLNHLSLGHQQINPNLFVNQMQQHPQLIRQNQQLNQQLNHQLLLQKLNNYHSQQRDLFNLRSSLNQLNGRGGMSSSSRQTQLDSMNRNLLNSQQLLKSLQLKGATSAQASASSLYPRSMNIQNANQHRARQIGHQQRVGRPAYSEQEKKIIDYLNQKQNGMKMMVNQTESLDKIFGYLSVRDLIQCRLVSKTFNRLASNKQHWKRLSLKNLAIRDWEYFGSEIVDANQVEELCLEGLRLPTKMAEQTDADLEDELWSGFRSCYLYFQSLNKLSLGRISIQQLARLLANEEQLMNPLFSLQELSIRNLYDQSAESGLCSLKPLNERIGEFKRLQLLRIESKQGISNDDYTISLLSNLSETLPTLRSLYLPSLKGFSNENFEFLIKLDQLECLEIGSCESWTLGENASQEEDGGDARMDHDGGSLLNETERPEEDDEFLNENQENEFNRFRQRSSPKRHRGAFKYLSQLRNLKQLYLTDVIIDEMSNQLPLVVEKMRDLESLGLGYVTVSPEATQTLNMLCNTLKNKLANLKRFSISTDDPQTNRSAFDLLLKRLDNLEELRWKVHTQVEDDGNCLVPFAKERGIESDLDNEENLDLTLNNEDCIEMVETCSLNEVLQQNLKRTKVYILPQ